MVCVEGPCRRTAGLLVSGNYFVSVPYKPVFAIVNVIVVLLELAHVT